MNITLKRSKNLVVRQTLNLKNYINCLMKSVFILASIIVKMGMRKCRVQILQPYVEPNYNLSKLFNKQKT